MTSAQPTPHGRSKDRIAKIEIERGGVVRYKNQIEAERRKAIDDLLAGNSFHVAKAADLPGPYDVRLSRREDRLIFNIRPAGTSPKAARGKSARRSDGREVSLNLAPLRRTIRDYFTVCENYFEAGTHTRPGRLEAIDAGRKALHNAAAQELRDRLAGRIDIDQETARRLFTLICVMHIKG